MSKRTWIKFTRVLVIAIVVVIAFVLFRPWLLLESLLPMKNDSSLVISVNTEEGASDLQFTPDGRAIASRTISQVDLRSVRNGKIIRRFKMRNAYIFSITMHPEKPLLAVGDGDGLVWLWDYEADKVVHTFSMPTTMISSTAFSPDGNYLAAGANTVNALSKDDHELAVWQLDDFALIQQIEGRDTGYGVEFSHDNKYLISSNPFRMWNIEDGSLVRHLSGGSALWGIKVSKNAPYTIASAFEGKEIYLWDQQNNKLEIIASRPNYICAIAISNNGQLVASAPCLPITQDHFPSSYDASDQSIRIWNRADGSLVQEIALPIRDTHTLTFSPDGSMIAAANGLYGPITVWRVAPNNPIP